MTKLQDYDLLPLPRMDREGSLQISDLEREGPCKCKFFMPYTLDCWGFLETPLGGDYCEVPHSFPTLKEAVECAKIMLEYLKEAAVDEGWHNDMDKFKIVDGEGTVHYYFKRIKGVRRPDDIDEEGYSSSTDTYWYHPKCMYVCDYELCEVVETVFERIRTKALHTSTRGETWEVLPETEEDGFAIVHAFRRHCCYYARLDDLDRNTGHIRLYKKVVK